MVWTKQLRKNKALLMGLISSYREKSWQASGGQKVESFYAMHSSVAALKHSSDAARGVPNEFVRSFTAVLLPQHKGKQNQITVRKGIQLDPKQNLARRRAHKAQSQVLLFFYSSSVKHRTKTYLQQRARAWNFKISRLQLAYIVVFSFVCQET